jgi:hypothetical protein
MFCWNFEDVLRPLTSNTLFVRFVTILLAWLRDYAIKVKRDKGFIKIFLKMACSTD